VSVVGTIQDSLERALHRARLADDREVMGRVRTEGHRLVFLLNGIVRGNRLYASDNSALDGPSRDAANVLRGLVDLLGSVQIACVEDHIYINDVRLRVQPHEQPAIDVFVGELSRHRIGGISFHGALSPESLKALARQISAPAHEGPDPRASLAGQLLGLPEVQLRGKFRFRLKGEAPTTRGSWSEVLQRGAAAAAAAMGAKRLANPVPARRAVIDLVEGLKEDESRGTALLRGQAPGDRHLLSVTNLSLSLGLALGFDDTALSDLGVAAMFHDVGYAKGADKDHHAVAGLRALLRQRGFHEGKIRRLRAVLEHHDPFGPAPSLFARILKIVDDYDILTSPRPDGHPTLPPPMAQGAMWAARGSVYDPDLLAIFAQVMGAYPPGSLIELSDGRWGLVTSGGRDKDRFVWPVVRIVREADGREASGQRGEDLFLRREQLRPKRVLNPATIGIDVGPMLDRVFRTKT
jgi:HD domain